MVVSETPDREFRREIKERSIDELPDGEVLIRVHYSSLNYKDALSATGNRGVTRKYPHTPGIDAAGVVEESCVEAFVPGDEVVVNGYDLGMNTSGGFSGYIRVPANWVLPLPSGLSLREAMIAGTAGVTAALSVAALQDGGVTPDRGPVLVTGATGGVGLISVMILSKLGYEVTAATGKWGQEEWLARFGAAKVIGREDVLEPARRALLQPTWAGAIDTVGGAFLDSVLRATQPRGVVTACGNVAGHTLETNVYPFILRGIRLQGIDSAECPLEIRRGIWAKLGSDWKPNQLNDIAEEYSLDELSDRIDVILRGAVRGRTVIRITQATARTA